MAETKDITRRDAAKVAGAAAIAAVAAPVLAGAPAIIKARAATNAVKYGMIGTGSRGTYLLKHLKGIDTGSCVAICDITDDALNKAVQTIGGNPKKYKDYRELLADKDVEAVFVTTPLFLHFPVTKDALEAGKHVFCEKSMVFKPEEVHALRAHGARAPQADPAGGPAAPLQRDVHGRQADDRKGTAGRRHLRPGAVAPQPGLEDEEGRPQPDGWPTGASSASTPADSWPSSPRTRSTSRTGCSA